MNESQIDEYIIEAIETLAKAENLMATIRYKKAYPILKAKYILESSIK